MIGAICGDIVGSTRERYPIKFTDFSLFEPGSRFTDDTVMTVAAASVLLGDATYVDAYREFGHRYPHAGYGGGFRRWLTDADPKPYNSYGNGSAMRVSPVAWAKSSIDDMLAEAERSAEVTHNHPEGIKGAQAVALAVFRARQGSSKDEIRDEIERQFEYDLRRTVEQIRPAYRFDVTCQGSVPEAIIAFLDSDGFESAVRLAVSLGGDSDTQACIAGAIAEAHYGVPEWIAAEARRRLASDLLGVVDRFLEAFHR
jgi:ADP-ribosylglycohydrolase